jgi:hypothetical protein
MVQEGASGIIDAAFADNPVSGLLWRSALLNRGRHPGGIVVKSKYWYL